MIRLLITGNSHVAALKGGWDQIKPDYSSWVEVDFFAGPAGRLQEMVFANGRYGLESSVATGEDDESEGFLRAINGRTSIEYLNFDHVLIASAPFRHESLAMLLSQYDVDGLGSTGKGARLSHAAFSAALQDIAEATNTALPVEQWHAEARGQVHLLIWPRPVETVLEQETINGRPNPWKNVTTDETHLRRALDSLDDSLENFFGSLGITVIPRRQEEIGPNGLTPSRFKAGATRLRSSEDQPDDDVIHMNADYGSLVLRNYLDGLLARV